MLPITDEKEIFYQLALAFTEQIGAKTGRILLNHYGSATNVFKAPLKEIKSVEGVGEGRAKFFRESKAMERADAELQFINKHNIQVLYTGGSYPYRLAQCSDAPLLLYYKGNANLDDKKIVAIVGTRKNTEYGTKLCEDLVTSLQGQEGIVVISGLAYGIDTIAHKRAVQLGMPTVGVMGNGLDKIYPATNKNLAKEMVANGGILSEFPSGTIPDRTNFPMRNRVVAGISDITVVVESHATGGALITARMANGYNREVAAFPGRVGDTRSEGCNELIRTNVAAMITRGDDLLELMNWKGSKKPVQRQLFLNLTTEEQKVIDSLQSADSVHADELSQTTGLAYSQLAATLLGLEMQGLIKSLPGKLYRMS